MNGYYDIQYKLERQVQREKITFVTININNFIQMHGNGEKNRSAMLIERYPHWNMITIYIYWKEIGEQNQISITKNE